MGPRLREDDGLHYVGVVAPHLILRTLKHSVTQRGFTDS
jgi:hypothetical protein